MLDWNTWFTCQKRWDFIRCLFTLLANPLDTVESKFSSKKVQILTSIGISLSGIKFLWNHSNTAVTGDKNMQNWWKTYLLVWVGDVEAHPIWLWEVVASHFRHQVGVVFVHRDELPGVGLVEARPGNVRAVASHGEVGLVAFTHLGWNIFTKCQLQYKYNTTKQYNVNTIQPNQKSF